MDSSPQTPDADACLAEDVSPTPGPPAGPRDHSSSTPSSSTPSTLMPPPLHPHAPPQGALQTQLSEGQRAAVRRHTLHLAAEREEPHRP
ncbi:hypothetical protein CesoFtcFv8_008358 [Champsocephalus esox]|uniref:Uncharacterized protein n=1 Tax=Champsocephalus esox TaxID=159716 RepID=A0AAN8CBA1_9TELE|nr:hypothetical protein CesoFtcFv8_008358 [Champsocephalus esox]